MNILLVDDDAAVLDLLTKALQRSGYATDCAVSGVEGWRKLRSMSYSLMITDHDMPGLTGVELVTRMRTAHIDLPVILATANPPANTESLHLAAILQKPFTMAVLKRTVDDALHLPLPTGATPALTRLARRLLADEVGPGVPPDPTAAVTFGVFERLRGPLGSLAGVGGYRALLARAQALAGEEIRWLRTLRITVDGSLAGPDEPAEERDAQEVSEGETVLLAHLLGQLDTLIGSALTLRLLQEIWPQLEELDS
ncbi:MAG: response regulator [Candidatus Krumholzibacteriia bacterium]